MNLYRNENIAYLYDLKSKENMHLYYSVKERHGHILTDRKSFIQETASFLKKEIETYDFLIYPESSNTFLDDIVSFFDIPIIKVYKNNISTIVSQIDNLNLQKAEKKSHLERIGNMKNSFKINSLKATQRVKYQDLLFTPTKIPEGKGVILDDSHFSGTTFKALCSITGVEHGVFVFSK